ncbi:MAG: hypothetical protein ABIH46_12025, partial [Chloroflexota bacterium]
RRRLGQHVAFLYSLLSRALNSFNDLDPKLRPYLVELASKKLLLPDNRFEQLLSSFRSDNSMEQTREFFVKNRSSIDTMLCASAAASHQELETCCCQLDGDLAQIRALLEAQRTELCEEFCISEITVKDMKDRHTRTQSR